MKKTTQKSIEKNVNVSPGDMLDSQAEAEPTHLSRPDEEVDA